MGGLLRGCFKTRPVGPRPSEVAPGGQKLVQLGTTTAGEGMVTPLTAKSQMLVVLGATVGGGAPVHVIFRLRGVYRRS